MRAGSRNLSCPWVQTSLLPRRLGEIQFIDYRSRDLRAGLALTRAINGVRPPRPLPDPLPEPPPVPMSYLNDLRDQVDGAAKLSFQEQAALLFELKGQLEESDAREAVLDLLHRMRRRDDLLARLAGEIDAMLAEAMAPPRERKPPRKAAPVADEPAAAHPVAPGASATEPKAIVSSATRGDSEADEIACILLRVVQHKESWLLGEDPQNHIRVDPRVTDGGTEIIATATCRDDVSSTKANALKKCGWKANESTADTVFGAAAGAAFLYATSGLGALALLSRKVRDYMMTVEMQRTWQPGTTQRRLTVVAEELWEALQTIKPELKIVSMKQLAPSEEGEVSYASS